ncbi:MAG: competence/damage-inducible protein A [Actinomycetota bacterium]|nr:competence/damage-inducible protein A [Actinomycetota bacterium]
MQTTSGHVRQASAKEPAKRAPFSVEVVAIGTELLLGHLDSNSSWIGEQLALAGIDCYFQTRVGDNVERISEVLGTALQRADAVVTCGGLGPTQDDVTREALARLAGVDLVRDPALAAGIEQRYAQRGRAMPTSNLRQADLPRGARPIPPSTGTAPGIELELPTGLVLSVPGVPSEMQDMVGRHVVPALVARAGSRAVIVSRVLRTWGLSESAVAEMVAPRVEALDEAGNALTIAFLASGIEGIKVRLTAKAADHAGAGSMLDREEAELRRLLGDRVFGVDGTTMEMAVGTLLEARGLTVATAESLTGGMVASRLVSVPGAGAWMLGGVVAYDTAVKHTVLGVAEDEVVTAGAAQSMARGVRSLLGASIGLSLTGVAGPDSQEDKPPGTVFCGLSGPGSFEGHIRLSLPGDRDGIRQLATISALDWLRRKLV